MASSVAWGIDIGRFSLKAVKIRNIKGELEIEALHYYQYDKIAPGLDVTNASRQALDTLIEEVGAKKIKRDAIAVCLPGQTAFCRFLELPPVDEKKIDETIALEAKQQIPFPIENVNWGYHKIDRNYGPGEQVEVGIFAIKKEAVQDFVNELKGAGLEPELLTIAPLALYNFASFDCKTGGGTILLDIGADQTNLVIIDGERLWIRNLPIAGNDITKSLQDKFQIPFKEAEKLKKNARKSSNAKKIFSVMQPVLKDFLSEVHRSLGFYKSKQKKAKLSRILLTGNGTKLFNLSSFLGKELEYKIRRVQQLNHFSIDPEADMELLKVQLPSFSVAFGLAIQAVGAGKADVNLLPRAVVQRQTIQQKAPMVFAGAILLLLGAVLAYFIQDARIAGVNDRLEMLSSPEVSELEDAEEDLEEVVGQLKEPMQRIGEMQEIVTERLWPVEIAERLNRVIPDGSALPWRDEGADDERVKIPAGMPEKIVDLELPAENAVNEVNTQKTWVTGMSLQRAADGEQRFYTVRLTVAKEVANRSDAALLSAIKAEIASAIAREFGFPAGVEVRTVSQARRAALFKDAAQGTNFYQVGFEWGFPVDAWLESLNAAEQP